MDSRWRWVAAVAILAAGIVYIRGQSLEIKPEVFERNVIRTQQPVLVWFNTVPNCPGNDWRFRMLKHLRRKWRGALAVYYVNARAYPQLAKTSGVDVTQDVFALFKPGRDVKQLTCVAFLERVSATTAAHPPTAKSLFDVDRVVDEANLAELEAFANLR